MTPLKELSEEQKLLAQMAVQIYAGCRAGQIATDLKTCVESAHLILKFVKELPSGQEES